jgi:hypothetical protein
MTRFRPSPAIRDTCLGTPDESTAFGVDASGVKSAQGHAEITQKTPLPEENREWRNPSPGHDRLPAQGRFGTFLSKAV